MVKGRLVETKEKKDKKSQIKTTMDNSITPDNRTEQETEADTLPRTTGDQKTVQLPTMTDMERMFAALENSLKSEMTKLHKDMGHMLARVEEVEKKADTHTRRIKELKGEIKNLKQEQQEQACTLEDQENKERRKNLRIRRFPELPQTENLIEVIGQVLNPTSTNEAINELKIKGAHRTRRPLDLPNETSRDIVVRFL